MGVEARLTPGAWPRDITSARFASRIRRGGPAQRGEVAIIGLPDDTGVVLNGGRPGAREGPAAFRAALARYGTAEPDVFAWPPVVDLGDVPASGGGGAGALAEMHRRTTEAVGEALAAGALPVCIGGGHDLTFPTGRAVCERGPAAVVYFDPHLDVRAEVGSGMPFRALVEWCGVAALHNVGFGPMVNSAEHVRWFRGHGGIAHAADGPAAATVSASLGLEEPRLIASFDLDVLDAGIAPGVSALNPDGWSAARAGAWVEACGRDPAVVAFDLMELCPAHDEGGRTARLAAHLFLRFLRGVSARG